MKYDYARILYLATNDIEIVRGFSQRKLILFYVSWENPRSFIHNKNLVQFSEKCY